MGKIFTKARNPFRNYNLENRVHKLLEQEKREPSPRYPPPDWVEERNEPTQALPSAPSTAEEIRKLALGQSEESPSSSQSTYDLMMKNENLLDRMGQLKIVSEGVNPDLHNPSTRSMPMDRRVPSPTDYGHVEPDKVMLGKMTMRQIVEALVDHSREPEVWSASVIAEHYNIDAERAANLTKHYRVFDIHIPKNAVEGLKDQTINAQNYEEVKKRLIAEK